MESVFFQIFLFLLPPKFSRWLFRVGLLRLPLSTGRTDKLQFRCRHQNLDTDLARLGKIGQGSSADVMTCMPRPVKCLRFYINGFDELLQAGGYNSDAGNALS